MYGHERSLVDEYSGRPFVLLGVNTDTKIETVKTAIKKNNLNWRSWYDGSRGPIVASYGIQSFPTILLVDHKGVVRYKNVRGDKLEAAIEKLVEEAEADGVTGGAEPVREFVDATGKHKMVGSYVSYEDGTVMLKGEEGNQIPVPWQKLSVEDRCYIAQIRLRADDLDDIAKRNIDFEFDDPVEFTDVSGKHTIQGTYMGLYQGNVIIWDRDGKQIKVKRKQLDEQTLERIREIGKARKKD